MAMLVLLRTFMSFVSPHFLKIIQQSFDKCKFLQVHNRTLSSRNHITIAEPLFKFQLPAEFRFTEH
jgi:hypothetical protein